ncbi:MAG: hypothetical protein ACR2QF_01195 [Geminicoccaceae bacterium]
MATEIFRPARDLGPKVEYLKPGDLPSASPADGKTVYVLREKVIERHHTGWGFDAFNEFMNKALATFAFVCIAGVALAMLILAFAVVSRI